MDFSKAWINGRSLKNSLSSTKANHSFQGFSPTDRVPLDVERDLYALGIEREHAAPFVIDNDLLVTAHDHQSPSKIVVMANLRFTEYALRSGANELITDPLTNEIEGIGNNLLSLGKRSALDFSQKVCAWGGGQRVWGNLKRHYPEEQLATLLYDWLTFAETATNGRSAISPGHEIKGLGISFASKHLRMFKPTHYAVLDDVVSQGLGYALNPAGFNLFISDLKRIRDEHFPDLRLADIEAGLFVLSRQIVRATGSG